MINTTTDELKIEISADTGNAAQNINQTAKAMDDLGKSAGAADNDVTALVKAMSEAAANMVSTAQSISNSVSGLTSFETMANTTQSTLAGLNFRFDTLNSSILQSYGAFDSAAASVRELSDASATSASALNGVVTATDGFAERMGELQTNTQSTSDSMSELQRGFVEALSSLRSFTDNIDSAGRDAADASARIKELSLQVGSIPTSQPVALAAGFKTLKSAIATLGVVKFVKDTNSAYVVQMQNELKLTSHMKHRINATDEEIKAIKELASAQQKIGVIGDEIQLAGAQQLTTYARESNTLKTLIPAMNNLIAQTAGYEATTGDATSAADMLGRALNGQYTSLKRMGVTFTEAQEQVLKYGTESQKAAVLADAINSKVGNLNELLAQTPTGQLKQLQNDFGDLQEEIGATFQPLISAIVPVARSVMETLREPILNVSRGISTIGAVISSADPAFVRGIALAAGGVAALNLLRKTIGGTSAGLLVLGVVLAGIIGSMQEEQVSVSDVVANAMRGAEKATDSAENAMEGYNEQIENTERSINRLAGFDTITKLSGGSSGGAITNALFGNNGMEQLEEAVYTIGDVNDAISSITTPNIDFSNIDFSKLPAEINKFLKDIKWHEIYAGAKSFLDEIEWETVFGAVGEGVETAVKLGYDAAVGILEGLEDWSNKQDWGIKFLKIGDGLGEVLGKALNIFDSIFNTKIGEWYNKLREKSAEFGRTLEQAVNPADEGNAALEKYHEEHGDYASNDFLKLYKSGVSAEDAFRQVYNTQELKSGFFTQDFKDAVKEIPEWSGLNAEDLARYLDPASYAQLGTKEIVDSFMTGNWWDQLTTSSKWWLSPQSMQSGIYSNPDYLSGVDVDYGKAPEKTSSGRGDIPLRSTDWVSGGTPQLNISLTAYVDGVEHDARIDNDKGW